MRAQALRRALVGGDSIWTDLQVRDETGSTNADVADAARAGAPEGLVIVAEQQSAGRGRAGRSWEAPLRSGLAFSVLLRPPPDSRADWGWLPLLAGLAVLAPIRELTGINATLKWPNDVMVGDRKLAGLLAEVVGDAVVVGIGLNVSLRADELPVPTATSLAIARPEGADDTEPIDREPVLRAVLRDLGTRYERFARADTDSASLRADYRAHCSTVGRDVAVSLPGGRIVRGRATDVDESGRIVVRLDTGDSEYIALAAGDVEHLR